MTVCVRQAHFRFEWMSTTVLYIQYVFDVLTVCIPHISTLHAWGVTFNSIRVTLFPSYLTVSPNSYRPRRSRDPLQ